MAGYVIKNPSVTINGTDVSDHIREVNVMMSAEDVDVTASGAGGKQHLQGIRDDRFELVALSDFAASQLDSIVYPLFSGASIFAVVVWPNSTVTSSSNPKFTGSSCILVEYNPVSGKIGDAAETPLTIPVNGTISKATT